MLNKFLLCLLLVSCSVAKPPIQNAVLSESSIQSDIEQHIRFLADDKLEGRRTGTVGEKLAAEYIKGQFEKTGIQPKGTDGYLQPFTINEGKEITEKTSLSIDGKSLVLNKDFFPFPYSSNGQIEALPSIALQEHAMPWFLDLKDAFKENASNPHFDVSSYIYAKAKAVMTKGATALVVYNSSNTSDGLKFETKDKAETLTIPVVYISKEAAHTYLKDPSAMVDIKISTDLKNKTRTGTNVIGYIDNGAPFTTIIGAHFDHLGYGEDHNSRYTGTDKQVHNGADDNASGTAALLELAKLLKNVPLKNNNYLFIAFSGEELGLYGSKHFTEQPTIPLSSVNYMINMDMVGRLNDSTQTITVGGYGTSPTWGEYYTGYNSTSTAGAPFKVKFDSSGTGPSDHTSFYLKDIPVLFYFTGLHSEYHTPADDYDKINYKGEVAVIRHVYSLLDAMDKKNTKLAFTKTREAQTTTSARFTVSMGIMPDYTFNGAGVRVDGVSEGKAAQKAGIKTGDIITSLGETQVTSLEAYMQALSKYKKGDKAAVKYKRGTQTLSTTVEF